MTDKSKRIETVCISCGNHLTITSVLCDDCTLSEVAPGTGYAVIAAVG